MKDKPMKERLSRRDFLRLAGVSVAGTLLASCAGQGAAPTTAPAANATTESKTSAGAEAVTLTVGLEAGNVFWTEFFEEVAANFTSETGIQIKPFFAPHADMKQRFITEELAGTGAIDIYMVDQPWVPQFAAAKYLVPIGDRVSAEDKEDFLSTALDTVSFNGELYGLPFLVHNSVMYYRTDLFEKAGLSKAPETWDEYRDYAKKLTNIEPGVYGTVMEGKRGPEPSAKYMDLLQQAGGRVLDEQGNVVLNGPEALSALKLMLAIQYEDQSSPPGGPGFDNVDTHTLFMQGKLAMAPNWPYMVALASDPKQSQVAGKFKIALQPGSVKRAAQVFSWGWGISTHSKNIDAAWKWVELGASSDVLARFGKKFTNPVPRKSSGEAVNNDSEVDDQAREIISIMTESVSVSETIPMVPQWDDIHSTIGLMVSEVMSKQAEPEAALADTEAEIKKILGKS
jgi:multiple sugar transport system substrate-binding protein